MTIKKSTNKQSSSIFVQWFITFAAIVSILSIAAYAGVFSLIYKSDISKITLIIGSLFTVGSLFAGKLSFDIGKKKVSICDINKKLRILYFLEQAFFSLGLLGTIIGFCIMMQGTLNAAVDPNQIIAQLKVGSSTKLYATMCGLVSYLLLQLQVLVIENNTPHLNENQ